MPAEPGNDECLLALVYRRSLTTVETHARRLRRNAKALRLAIEQSEREAKKLAKEKARLMKMKWGQGRPSDGRPHRPLDDGDKGTSSSDPPPVVDSYSCVGDPKGRGPVRKW
ncbi:Phosphorylated carbohydrates phosphatase [Hordeum vulgare]|nr:Phosphorylated carbohydrates phosphatase [Hordeum vulgare]